jgi:hypothetical protein
MIIYVAYSAVGLLSGAKALIVTHGVWTFMMIVAIGVAFQFPVVRGLWWLSFAPTESGQRQFGETAASLGGEVRSVCRTWRNSSATQDSVAIGAWRTSSKPHPVQFG